MISLLPDSTLCRSIVQALGTPARRPCERRCRGRCRQESPPSCGWADRGRRPARLPTQGPCRLRTAGRQGKIISWVGLLSVLLTYYKEVQLDPIRIPCAGSQKQMSVAPVKPRREIGRESGREK